MLCDDVTGKRLKAQRPGARPSPRRITQAILASNAAFSVGGPCATMQQNSSLAPGGLHLAPSGACHNPHENNDSALPILVGACGLANLWCALTPRASWLRTSSQSRKTMHTSPCCGLATGCAQQRLRVGQGSSIHAGYLPHQYGRVSQRGLDQMLNSVHTARSGLQPACHECVPAIAQSPAERLG